MNKKKSINFKFRLYLKKWKNHNFVFREFHEFKLFETAHFKISIYLLQIISTNFMKNAISVIFERIEVF